jgi:transcriptional regulator with XRE-family HTH domain
MTSIKPEEPNPIDVHIRARPRLRRTLLGMSQKKLGEAIGLTFEQVKKYERGANRVSASRLYELSLALGVPVSYFFDDMPSPDNPKRPSATDSADLMTTKETLDLVRAYYATPDAARRCLYDVVKSVSRAMSGSTRRPRGDQ